MPQLVLFEGHSLRGYPTLSPTGSCHRVCWRRLTRGIPLSARLRQHDVQAKESAPSSESKGSVERRRMVSGLPVWTLQPDAGSVQIPFRCGGCYDKVVSD